MRTTCQRNGATLVQGTFHNASDIKTSEALRLGKKDVIKLKRFINKKV